MVVRIRFAMHGHRNNKFFHIVAINSKQRRDAKPIETLGIYRHKIDTVKDRTAKSVEWSVARIKYWLGVGAQPSEAAVRLFTQGGILPPDSKHHPSPKKASNVIAIGDSVNGCAYFYFRASNEGLIMSNGWEMNALKQAVYESNRP